MGRTKSWLALVLAIVMVLGMAVPTAFAAEPTMLFGTKAHVTISDATLTINMGDDPVQVNMYKSAVVADNQLTEKNLDETVTTEYLDVDTDAIKVVGGDGFFTVEAVDLTAAAGTTFTVISTVDETEYEGTFKVIVKPTVAYGPKEISMDTQTTDVTKYVRATDFVPNPSTGKVTFDTTAGIGGVAGKVTATKVGSGEDLWLLTAVDSGECEITAKVYVDGLPTAGLTVTIPVHIGKTTANGAYKIATNVPAAGLTIARNAAETARSFKISFVTAAGTVVKPVTGTPLPTVTAAPTAPYTIKFEADSDDDIELSDGASAGLIANPNNAFSITDFNPTTGEIKFKFSKYLIRAKGKVTIGYAGDDDNLLNATFPLNVTPVAISTGLTSNKLVLDLVRTAPGAQLTKNSASFMVTSSAELDFVWYFVDELTAAGITVDRTLDPQITLTAPAGTAVGDYEMTVYGVLADGETPTESKKITVSVVDSTKVPTFTANPAKVSLNTQAGMNQGSALVAYTIGNYIGTGTTVLSVSLSASLSGMSTPVITTATKTITFAAGSLTNAKGTATITGTVDGEPIEPVEIEIEIADKTPGVAHHFVAAPAAVSGKISESPRFQVSVVDYDGNPIEGVASGTIQGVVRDTKDTANATTLASVNANDASGWFTVTPVGGGDGIIKITSSTYSTLEALKVPLTIIPMEVKSSVSSIALDLINDPCETKFTVTATTGTITDIRAVAYVNGVADTSKFTVAKDTSVGATPNTFIVTGVAELKRNGKIVVTTEVDALAANTIEIPVTVANTTAITSTKSALTFEMKDGGKKIDTFVADINGSGTQKITSVTIEPETVATIEDTTATTDCPKTIKVTAVANGKAVITIKGSLNGKALPDLLVTVDVVDEQTKPILTSTPASVSLSLLDGGKATETLAITSNVGTIDAGSIVITASPAGLVEIDGTKITAKAKGTGTLSVNAKINGVDAETLFVPFAVIDGTEPSTGAGVYINGVKYESGSTFYVPNNFKLTDYKVTRKTDDGTEITDVTLSRSIAKSAKVKKQRLNIANKVYIVPTQTFGKTKLTVKATGLADLTIELNVARLPEVDNTKVPGITENPQAGTRGYFFDYQTTNTAEAYYTQPKFWNFKTSKESVAKVKANGLIEFYKAGTVTLTATRKSNNKSLVTKFTLNLTVTDEYLNTGSWVAVLSNSTKKDAIAGVLSSQNYPKGTAGASYDYTKAGYDEMIAYLQANAKETDVSAVYIDGAITKNGFTLSGTTISLTDLAADLAKVPGKIFLTLNGAASTLYSSKDADATPADIAKVFAAAEAGVQSKATALSTVGTNGFWSSQKFYVLSATQKKSQTSVSDTKADAVADAFIKALTLTDGKFSNGDTRLTLKELYTKVKKDSGKVIGYYPSAVKGVAVGYNYVP